MNSLGLKRVNNLITDELLKGEKSGIICELVSTKFGIKQRMSEKHLSRVKKELIKRMDIDKPFNQAKSILVKQELFNKALDNNELKLCLDINVADDKLKGLLVSEQVMTVSTPLQVNIMVNTTEQGTIKPIIELNEED